MLASAILQRVIVNPTSTVIRGETTTAAAFADTGVLVPGDVSCANLDASDVSSGTASIGAGGTTATWVEDELLAAGQDLVVPVSGGDGATYKWDAHLIYNAANQSLTAQLDGSGADMETVLQGMGIANIATGTGVVFTGGGMGAQTGELSNNVGAGAPVTIRIVDGTITQRAGEPPIITCDGYEVESATRNALSRTLRRTTAGAITSFGIHSTGATGLAAGSWLRIRRVA